MSPPSAITVTEVAGRTDLETFLDVADICQSGDPHYITPLRMMQRDQLNPKKNPWFARGEAKLWIARQNGKPVGRISAQVDRGHLDRHKDATGFFGFFECCDDADVAGALFDTAGAWLKEQGMRAVRGPFSLSINEETGLLIDGFDCPPRMMMGHAPPYYATLVEGAGFAKVMDMYAYLVPMDTALPPQVKRLMKSIRSNKRVSVRPLNPKRYDEDIAHLVRIFNEGWADNWGFVPMNDAEAAHFASELKMIIIPDLVYFAEYDGEPVAMAVALPDLNEAVADLHGKLLPFGWAKLAYRLLTKRFSGTRVPLMGVLPRFRGKAMGSVLALLTIGSIREASLKLHLPISEMSWVLEDNTNTRHSLEDIGGRAYKTYRVYERSL